MLSVVRCRLGRKTPLHLTPHVSKRSLAKSKSEKQDELRPFNELSIFQKGAIRTAIIFLSQQLRSLNYTCLVSLQQLSFALDLPGPLMTPF